MAKSGNLLSSILDIRFIRVRPPFGAALALAVIFSVSILDPAIARSQEDDDGLISIFDGETLNGWEGDPRFWSVEDGAITGQWKPGMGGYEGGFGVWILSKLGGEPTFLIWQGGSPKDFEMKLDFRIKGGNSGVHYRSYPVDTDSNNKWAVGGVQADVADNEKQDSWIWTRMQKGWAGRLVQHEPTFELAFSGEQVEISEDGEKIVVGSFGTPEEMVALKNQRDWNTYHITAIGNHMNHKINGHQMIDAIDHQGTHRDKKGLIALQIHVNTPMKVQFRNIRLKILD